MTCSPRLQPDPLAQSSRTGEKMGRWAGGHISTEYTVCARSLPMWGQACSLLLPEHTPLQPQQECSTQVLPGALQNEDMSSRVKVPFPSCVKQLERRNPERGQHPQNSGGKRWRRGAPLLQPSLRQVHPAAFTVVWFPQPLAFVA